MFQALFQRLPKPFLPVTVGLYRAKYSDVSGPVPTPAKALFACNRWAI